MLPQIINGAGLLAQAIVSTDLESGVTQNNDGGHQIRGREQAAIQAMNDFYAAFNRRDVDQCMSLWAHTDSVVMCNPIGGIRRGWHNIADGYRLLMEGNLQVYVEFYDYQWFALDEVHFFIGRERGTASLAGKQLQLDIRTSRVFQWFDTGWAQVHHHGSITEPQLLRDYQSMLGMPGNVGGQA